MAADKRYTPANPVPEEVLKNMAADAVFSPGFSIKGHAKAGRASYLVSLSTVIAENAEFTVQPLKHAKLTLHCFR
jgi:hypothetical protein